MEYIDYRHSYTCSFLKFKGLAVHIHIYKSWMFFLIYSDFWNSFLYYPFKEWISLIAASGLAVRKKSSAIYTCNKTKNSTNQNIGFGISSTNFELKVLSKGINHHNMLISSHLLKAIWLPVYIHFLSIMSMFSYQFNKMIQVKRVLSFAFSYNGNS